MAKSGPKISQNYGNTAKKWHLIKGRKRSLPWKMVILRSVFGEKGKDMEKAQEHKFIFKLEGDEHDFDAENLSAVLSSLSGLVKHVQETNYPNSKSSVKITANSKGSFTVESAIMLALAPNLISSIMQGASSLDSAKQCFDALLMFFDLKKHIHDTPVESIKIHNSDGAKVLINKDNRVMNITNNFFILAQDFLENPNADKLVSRLCSAVEDENKQGFTIQDSTRSLRLDHNDCSKLSTEIIAPALNEIENVETRRATIHIRKPDLIGNTKWDIIYQGSNVKAKMLDLNFIERVHNGKVKLSNDTKVSVEMRVKVFLDKKKRPTIGEYEIVKVFEE